MTQPNATAQKSTSPGTDVAERPPIDLARVPDSVRQLVDRLKLSASMDSVVSAQVSIMDKILTATSEDEIFAAADAGTLAGKDHGNRPFLLRAHDWRQSAPGYIAQGAFPFYALCEVTWLDDGSEAVLNCGGFSFVSVLDALDRNGHLEKHPDGYPMILDVRQSQAGFDVVVPRPFRMRRPETVVPEPAQEKAAQEKAAQEKPAA